MKTKICTRCKLEKPFTDFNKGLDKYGLQFACKECLHEYYESHREHKLKYTKEYYLKHPEEIKKYRKFRKKEIKSYMKKWRNLHKKEIKISKNNWDKNNYKEIAIYRRKYKANKFKTDINFKILWNLRTRIVKVLKGKNKSDRTMQLIGCSIDELMLYLQKQFKSGMTWDNYGNGCNGKGMREWNIDHIIPCASFNLTKASEQRKCFNYTNLQPLWAKENLRKSDKY